jgi:adenosylhomocysteine nucleosidase
VDFLVIRSLSDLAGGGASLNEILTFIGFAAKNSVTVLRAILAKL